MKSLPTILLLIASLPAAAAPGAFEINQDCAVAGCFELDSPGLPVSIAKSGSYVLTSDLVVDTGGNAIEISPLGVYNGPLDIDLNGHTIDGGASCTGTPVTSCSPPLGGNAINAGVNPPMPLHIHNGTLRGFVTAIALFHVEDGTLLEHLTITQNTNNAIFVTSDQPTTVRIRDSQITRNGNQGIFASMAAFIENTSIVGNLSTGVSFNVTHSVITGSRISNNGGKGVDCSDPQEACALGQNTFAGNNGGGVQFAVSALSDMGGNVCLDHASGVCP